MPCLWLQHDKRQLFCTLAVLPVESSADIARSREGTAFAGPVVAARALIDTGATTTCISNRLAQRIELEPIGKVPVQGVSHVSYHFSFSF